MFDLTSSRYFNALSGMTQESIKQSGTNFETEDELREFVSNLENSKS